MIYKLYISNFSLKCRCDLVQHSLTDELYFSGFPVGYFCGVYQQILREFLCDSAFKV